jgi:hypothetical protein
LPDGASEIFVANGLDTNSQSLPVGQISACGLARAATALFDDGVKALAPHEPHRLEILDLTRFLHANRCPLRWKTL